MRYAFTDITKRFDGARVYKTTFYPVIPPRESDIYITASDNDYLDSLAKRYYNDESFWWIIANANNLGKGKLSIPAGTVLRIPTDITPIIQDLQNIN
jgi:hypothetical protein